MLGWNICYLLGSRVVHRSLQYVASLEAASKDVFKVVDVKILSGST